MIATDALEKGSALRAGCGRLSHGQGLAALSALEADQEEIDLGKGTYFVL
jgi:hypothetical protein